MATGEVFAEFIDYRTEHPSDDIMTDLLNVEFTDETGTVRRLSRDELLMYLTVVATAGAETTTRLIGWAGKTLADNPDQRRELVGEPRTDPAGDRGDSALGTAGFADRPLRHPRHRVLRPDRARGQRDVDAGGRRQPRPPPVSAKRRCLRHPPGTTLAHDLRCRNALLHGQRTGPAGGPHRAGGDPQTLPRMGGRLAQRASRRRPRLSVAGNPCPPSLSG